MSYTLEEAKALVNQLREATDDERCDVVTTEDEWEEGLHDVKLLTPTYELTPGVLKALHQAGPFSVRHLGQVRENDSRHVWLLKE